MPNWAVGTLKIRGTKKNIKNFVLGALAPIPNSGAVVIAALIGEDPKEPEFKIVENDEACLEIESENGFHISGTRRNYIDESRIEIYFDKDDGEDEIAVFDFQAAWGPDTGRLAELAKEFGVDLRLYVFERGMQYNFDFEVSRTGEVIRSQEITFDDYKWECIMPHMGG